MDDFFLQNKPKQPKRAVAEAVRARGIRVPEIYDSVEEARRVVVKEGKKIIIRSELKQDYYGASDVVKSHVLDYEDLQKYKQEAFQRAAEIPSIEKMQKEYNILAFWLREKFVFSEYFLMNQLDVFSNELAMCSLYRLRSFARQTNQELDTVLKSVSFSFWEYIPGVNYTVVADDVIPGKFHVFVSKELKEKNIHLYINTYDDRAEVWPKQSALYNEENLNNVVRLYTEIQKLDCFDNRHCPIMEFQVDPEGKVYFLQYLRSRDFSTIDRWRLTPSQNKPNLIAPYIVRGATDPEGIELEVKVNHLEPLNIFDSEASACADHFLFFHQLASRHRKLNAMFYNSLDSYRHSLLIGHSEKGAFFYPQVALVLEKSVLPGGSLRRLIESDDENASIRLKVRSDGENAEVNFL